MKILLLVGVLATKFIQSQTTATCEPIWFYDYETGYDPIIPVLPLNYRNTHKEGEQYTFGYADKEFRSCSLLEFISSDLNVPAVWLGCLGNQTTVTLDPKTWSNDGKWRAEFKVTCGIDGYWHLDSPLAPGADDTLVEVGCVDPIRMGWSGWDKGCGLMPPPVERVVASSCRSLPLGKARLGYIYRPELFALADPFKPNKNYKIGESYELSFNSLKYCHGFGFLRGFRGIWYVPIHDIGSMTFDADLFFCGLTEEGELAHLYHNGNNSECCYTADTTVYPYEPLVFHDRFTFTCGADGQWHVDKKLMIGDVVDAVMCYEHQTWQEYACPYKTY